uniref:Uncharacterized protein n=1 Tax=Anopheles atroparvus TaxID=41427 RepID=A0A182JK63_ANOAO
MATLGLSKVFILDKYFTELQKFWETEKKLQVCLGRAPQNRLQEQPPGDGEQKSMGFWSCPINRTKPRVMPLQSVIEREAEKSNASRLGALLAAAPTSLKGMGAHGGTTWGTSRNYLVAYVLCVFDECAWN